MSLLDTMMQVVIRMYGARVWQHLLITGILLILTIKDGIGIITISLSMGLVS